MSVLNVLCCVVAVFAAVSCHFVPNHVKSNGNPSVKSTLLNNEIQKLVDRTLHERRSVSSLSPSQQYIAVEKHNELRRLEGSSDMETMVWNQELADNAQMLADYCWFDHALMQWAGSPYSQVGQNLYIASGAGSDNIAAAIHAWYDEKPDYTYSNGACVAGRMCGHYTQVVWAATWEVGCGMTFCSSAYNPTNGATYYNSNYLVCNYGPPGNFNNNKPFSLGSPCTQCRSGQMWCDAGLCFPSSCSSCSCNAQCQNGGNLDITSCSCSCADGFTGGDCSAACVDNDSRCGPANGWPTYWAGGVVCEDTHEYCGANPGWPVSWCATTSYVQHYCKAMCNLC